MLGTVFALLVGACASTPEPPPVDAKPPTYAEQIEERIAGASDREVHELRYNPGLCGCPPFELELEGRWNRVTFDVADDSHPVLVALREAAARGEDCVRTRASAEIQHAPSSDDEDEASEESDGGA